MSLVGDLEQEHPARAAFLKAAKSRRAKVLTLLAAHPKAPPEALYALTQKVLANTRTPLSKAGVQVIHTLIMREDLPLEVESRLARYSLCAKTSSRDLKVLFFSRSRYYSDIVPPLLSRLFFCKECETSCRFDQSALATLAARPLTPRLAGALHDASCGVAERTLENLAANLSTPVTVLAELLYHCGPSGVSQAVVRNPSAPYELYLDIPVYDLPADVLERFVPKPNPAQVKLLKGSRKYRSVTLRRVLALQSDSAFDAGLLLIAPRAPFLSRLLKKASSKPDRYLKYYRAKAAKVEKARELLKVTTPLLGRTLAPRVKSALDASLSEADNALKKFKQVLNTPASQARNEELSKLRSFVEACVAQSDELVTALLELQRNASVPDPGKALTSETASLAKAWKSVREIEDSLKSVTS